MDLSFGHELACPHSEIGIYLLLNEQTTTVPVVIQKGILPMKFIYPAVFRPTEDKKYNAFFPDLACCEAQGDTLDDAIENANAAAYDWIYTELMEFEGKLPPVSDESDLDLQEGDVVRNISVNIRFQDGWDE